MFSRCSIGVVPHVDVFVGRKVISTSYSSPILKVSPLISFETYCLIHLSKVHTVLFSAFDR